MLNSLLSLAYVVPSVVEYPLRKSNKDKTARNIARRAKAEKLEMSKQYEDSPHTHINNIKREENRKLDREINKLNQKEEALY